MAAGNLEERVATLEAEISQLKHLIDRRNNVCGWQKMIGAFLDDPYFEKAMEYGRK